MASRADPRPEAVEEREDEKQKQDNFIVLGPGVR